MTTSQAQKLAVQKYRAKTYDTIGFDVKKGKREEYKAAAAELGLSLAAFLTNAADEFIQNHAVENFSARLNTSTPPQYTLTSEERRLLDKWNKLPVSTQKKLAGLIDDLLQHLPT